MAAISAIRGASHAANVGRGLDGFRARQREDLELQPCGVPELDALLGGGFPRGSLVEVCGTASSGRTSLSLALLAQATRRQEACAFVDVSDALDPLSVAAAGVDTKRLLWVRCGGANMDSALDAQATRRETSTKTQWNANNAQPDKKAARNEDVHAAHSLQAGKPPLRSDAPALNQKYAALQKFPVQEKPHGFSWTHPRDALRGVETSIPGLLRLPPKAPSYEEMSFAVRCAGEQVEPDRQPPRRGANLRQRFFANAHIEHEHPGAGQPDGVPQPRFLRAGSSSGKSNANAWIRTNTKPWKRLEQALKTTDLLLHSGGWGVVVVDLGGISWVEARRIPIHTWFRFRRVVENSPTILLLLGEESCAKSCASLVLQCRRVAEKWSSAVDETISTREKNSDIAPACPAGIHPDRDYLPATGHVKSTFAVLQGFEVQGEIACSRMQRLATDAARWQTRTPYVRF